MPIAVLYYIGLNSATEGYLELLATKKKGIEGYAVINGETEELGPFSLVMSEGTLCLISFKARMSLFHNVTR